MPLATLKCTCSILLQRYRVRRLCSVLLLFVAGLGTQAVWSDVTQVSNNELQAMVAEGATVIDVRRLDEWQRTGVIEGSHTVTFFDRHGRYDVQAWLDEIGKITTPDKPVVLICARGVRTSKIATLLDKRLGFTQVHNVTSGIDDWIEQGLPVAKYSAENVEQTSPAATNSE